MPNTFVSTDFSGSNKITHSGIAKHFKNVEPHQALAELIWNGFDAGADSIDLSINTNNLGGTELVTLTDNGNGINFKRPEDNFCRFNDSLKKDSYDTHGSQGRGRLAFHKICNISTWYTRFNNENAKITILSSNLGDIDGKTIPEEDQHPSLGTNDPGTCVVLSGFKDSLPSQDFLIYEFRKIFGGHLALAPHKSLFVNNVKVTPQEHDLYETSITTRNNNFHVKLLHWKEKPGSEKSYTHFITSKSKVLYKYLSSLNKKRGYYSSIYVKSDGFDRFSADNDDLYEPIGAFTTSDDFRALDKELGIFARKMYAEFLIKQADRHVEKFEQDGDFPDYGELDERESQWRLSHVKDIVKAVLVRDPGLLVGNNKKQRRLIIQLLDRLSISSENSGIFEILESILSLDAAAMTQLANQLKKTKLDNIIKTIEALQHREFAIAQMKEIMNKYYRDTLETPDLQSIIENNTWLFGASYEILGAEEASFTETAKKLRSTIKEIENIDVGDLSDGVEIEGAKKQVDLLLIRKQPQFDSSGKKYFRCVIVEIKRPGVALNDKHLQQLDTYASILSRHPEFNSDLTRFELLLIGRTISSEAFGIQNRLDTSKSLGEPGIVTSTQKIKTYIKTWPRIFDEFELTNDYLLEKLKTQRADLSAASKADLVASLTAASDSAEETPCDNAVQA
ncbi:ATP-binding protein [Pseudomonas farsensis]|uniref:ATP-binding protein n=1 Tax=Pseudomonas farsensis TaxID=2745492 RepID=A0ABU8QN26_9PSED